MATVTGLTAERMIAMEAATVIDGEVIGDNLHLTTRGGTDINAGNVRGGKGDPGTPGTPGTPGAPGVIQSVNDQAVTAVYTPRIFPDKAALDAWTTAPIGIEAYTTAEATAWMKISSAWVAIPAQVNVASLADLKSKFPTAPTGMRAYLLDEDSECIGKGGVWCWWRKCFARLIGNQPWITWNSNAIAGSTASTMHIDGTSIKLALQIGLTTPSIGANVTVGTTNAPYRPAYACEGAGIGLTASTPGASRQILGTSGSVQVVYSTGSGGGNVSTIVSVSLYEVPNLIPA